MKKSTTNEFIEKSKKVHNERYDYSKVNYLNNYLKVEIICSKHNSFYQRPNEHLNGRGCPHCSKTKKSNTNEFIEKSKKVHGNTYCYDNVKYINCFTKIEIGCKIHGIYYQIPSSHLSGRGCPKCHFEKLSNITISKSQLDFLNFLKISSRNIHIGKFIVDGIDDKTNTIYEFLGDFWHGNPEKFNPTKIHPYYNKPFQSVYDYTFYRFKNLKDMKYNIKYLWESDWIKFKKNIDKELKILTF